MAMTFQRAAPFEVVAPFLLAAPLGVIAAGLIVLQTGHEAFVAINTPRLVAITHALVLGWITTMMVGATYQLGPVVLGGQLLSTRLARVQFLVHLVAVGSFVWVVQDWNVPAMGFAGLLLVISLLLYVINAGHAVWRTSTWPLPRMYIATSLGFLVLAGAFGITWVGTLEHHWFPVTFGRLAAHAHLGLVGWLALTLMGVSYQLVPMFTLASHREPRFGRLALAITSVATLLFTAAMLTDPPVTVRVLVAGLLVAGPLLWSIDLWLILRARYRRRLDIQGRATMASLVFLAFAMALGIGAAFGTPFTPDAEPARWPLAYGVAAILGWAGLAVIGNGVKIMAFLVWINRYQPRVGTGPIPMAADLYSARAANGVLALHVTATVILAGAALSGNLTLFHAGGLVLTGSGIGLAVVLGGMLIPRSVRPSAATAPGSARPS